MVLSKFEAIVFRVVEYDVPDRSGSGEDETIRLITSILDPTDTSAIELAAAYHERWEFEGLVDEIKTQQRGPGRALRSKSAELVDKRYGHSCSRITACGRSCVERPTKPTRIPIDSAAPCSRLRVVIAASRWVVCRGGHERRVSPADFNGQRG